MSATKICHGVDLVDVERLREVMGRHPDFAERVFTDEERAYCDQHPDPLPHYAARFAVKEATLKALGMGLGALGINRTLQAIELRRDAGPPTLALTGKPAKRASAHGVTSQAVSVSHDGNMAMASVVMLSEEDA